MARFLVQAITDQTEIAGLLWYDRDPSYEEGRLVPCDDLSLAEAFRLAGLCTSLGEARRVIGQGGAYVNNTRCRTDAEFRAQPMICDRYLLLRRGKKQVALLEVIPVRATVTLR